MAANQVMPDSTVSAASDADHRTEPATDVVAANATTGGPLNAIAAVTSAPPLSKNDSHEITRNNDNDQTGAFSSTTTTTAATMQTGSVAANATIGIKKLSVTPFHPVHAWLRCLTSPNLGLEHCQAYGTWSVP